MDGADEWDEFGNYIGGGGDAQGGNVNGSSSSDSSNSSSVDGDDEDDEMNPTITALPEGWSRSFYLFFPLLRRLAVVSHLTHH